MATPTPDTVRIIQEIIDNAVDDWSKTGYLTILNAVKLNLTGKVLNRDSGNLIAAIEADSYVSGGIIKVIITPVYGKAWENGFSRKSFFIKPVNAKALAWGGSVRKPPRAFKKLAKDQKFFSKGHIIPPGWFKERPFVKPAINDTEPQLIKLLEQKLQHGFDTRVPQWKININLQMG